MISLSEVHTSIQLLLKLSPKKLNYEQKNCANLTKKRLKMAIHMRNSVNHSIETHNQKTSLAQKKLVHTAILLSFTFRSKRRLNE